MHFTSQSKMKNLLQNALLEAQDDFPYKANEPIPRYLELTHHLLKDLCIKIMRARD